MLSGERFDVVQFEFAQMAGYRTTSARSARLADAARKSPNSTRRNFGSLTR
jgi:hypothetical protein